MRFFFKLTLLLFFTFHLTYSFHISPTFFEKRIDLNGGYQEYTMFNNSDKTQRFKITPHPGTGKFDGHMNKWIEFTPKIITIKPQSSAKLRVLIKAPKGTPKGEYSSFLNFKSIPLPKLIKEEDGRVGAMTRMPLSINLEFVGYVGDYPANLEISNLHIVNNKDKGSTISFNVKNNTKRGVWYNVDIIKNQDDYESIEKGRLPNGETESVKINLKHLKKRGIKGIRLRESSTYKEIVSKKL